jgi:hypothetical protein
MAKSVDEQINATMAKKVIGQTTELYKSALTGRSLQVRHSIFAASVPAGTGAIRKYTIWGHHPLF